MPKVADVEATVVGDLIGTGGPFGAEGPIIMTGGAIGSLIAQMLPVSDNERKTLLVAGAAAGMTTVFGTPIAAIMLAVELLLFEWTPRSFIPVAVAAIVAEVARTALHMPSPLFPFSGGMDITATGLVCWVAIGIARRASVRLADETGLYAGRSFPKMPIHWMWWPMIGGLVVGIGGLIDPRALGVGYTNIAANAATADDRPQRPASACRKGDHLGCRTRFRHVGRRARSAAHHWRSDGRSRCRNHAGGIARLLGASRNDGYDGRHDARAVDGDVLCSRIDGRDTYVCSPL